jgi:hypothetical protein
MNLPCHGFSFFFARMEKVNGKIAHLQPGVLDSSPRFFLFGNVTGGYEHCDNFIVVSALGYQGRDELMSARRTVEREGDGCRLSRGKDAPKGFIPLQNHCGRHTQLFIRAAYEVIEFDPGDRLNRMIQVDVTKIPIKPGNNLRNVLGESTERCVSIPNLIVAFHRFRDVPLSAGFFPHSSPFGNLPEYRSTRQGSQANLDFR